MNLNPLSTYVKLTRLVFNVEPSEKWEDCDEFEEDLRELYEKILCKSCGKLLIDPVVPKKNHFSCQHRVCLDCIGKKRSTPTNCQMCSDYTLFEKSHQTKLLLQCFQELCELVHTSWIYDYIQRRTNHDTGQKETPSLLEIIDAGMNYGSIVLDETSSDENSSSSDSSKEPIFTPQIFPQISPLPSVQAVVSPPPQPEQFTIISDPVIPIAAAPIAPLPPPTQPVPQIVQYQPQIVQSQLPSTSKLTPNNFIRYPPPMRIASATAPVNFSSPPTPTIYSVMYTGSGNKITLKRKPPDDVGGGAVAPIATGNNMTILKTENVMNSNFKRPPIQQPPNVITTPTSSNPNDPQKRRGCRCGNATAAPGKLTCCGQRCPCYVDSKACIDCKCKGCRNPHYVDGHKKMRHQVPDVKTQQQQQQNFLASIQQQTALVKDIKPVMPSTSMIKEEFNLMEQSNMNCIISMNNGQYQIKQTHPRIIVKEPVKTMSPIIFPTTTGVHQTTTIGGNSGISSNIQILGLYSNVPMMNVDNKKIIIKNEPAVVSFAETTKQHFETTTVAYSGNNLNTNLL